MGDMDILFPVPEGSRNADDMGMPGVMYPATFTMHTPSGPTHCCVKHARKLEALMRMLGAHTNAVKAPAGAECENCKNEAKNMPPNAALTGAEGVRVEGTVMQQEKT